MATKFHDIIRMLDTHLNQAKVDLLVKNNKQVFQEFQDPTIIPSQTRGIMVLMRKSCPFKLNCHTTKTLNCLAIKLFSVSNQELDNAFLFNSNEETDKSSNSRKGVNHLAESEITNQLIIGDYNTSLNKDLDNVSYFQDLHRASREFLHGLQDDGVFLDVHRFLYQYDISYT